VLTCASTIDIDFLARDTRHKHWLVVLKRHTQFSKQVKECFSSCCRLVLLNNVAAVLDDYHLELALHLGDRQLLVHPLAASQQELLLERAIQESLSQTTEPIFPILLCRHQVSAPDILRQSGGFVDDCLHLSRH